MTYAPDTLLAVRRLLLDHLPGLDPVSVGIVGDSAHRGGYHCGSDRLDLDDYSVRESPRDRAGLSLAASALDIGAWSATVAGTRHDLRSMSLWLVAQCRAGSVDTRDIREVIYSPDGTTVRRWDRLGIRSTGDSSHRWHTHISYHRDGTGRDQAAVWRRYLTSIGLIAAAVEGDDMTYEQADRDRDTATTHRALGLLTGAREVRYTAGGRERVEPNALAASLERIEATLVQALGRDLVDEQEIVQGVLAGLGTRSADEVAETLRAVYAGRPDELARLAELLAGAGTASRG